MSSSLPESPDNLAIEGETLLQRVRAATELLESIAADRALLGHVPSDERTRLLQAAGRVSRPDAVERRQLLKFTKRARKAEKVQRAESVLAETGIRKLRRQPVFTSPNVFPPASPWPACRYIVTTKSVISPQPSIPWRRALLRG